MKKLLLALAIALLAAGLISLTAFAATYEGYTQEQFDALTKTTVIASPDSPTGYYVTFRFPDAGYSRVRIYGEWAFTDPTITTRWYNEGKTPDQWEDGDTCWGTWQTADMTLANGTWVYTIPLPNGTYNFRYYLNGAQDAKLTDYTDAQMAVDPAIGNYVAEWREASTGEMYLTSVYVPYDESKQAKSARVEMEAPREDQKGAIVLDKLVRNDTQQESTFGVYLPYGYDASRADKYPILVLFHGGGGFYGSWPDNGLANMMDNLIAEGTIEPTIVVTPCGEDFAVSDKLLRWDRLAAMDFVTKQLLPYMTEKYDASDDAAKHALAGLSQGGACIMTGYFNYTEFFDYYICMSAPMKVNVYPKFDKPELKDVHLYLGYGLYDQVCQDVYFDANKAAQEGSTYEYVHGLSTAGVQFILNDDLPYGHQWTLWRQFLVNACETMLWK